MDSTLRARRRSSGVWTRGAVLLLLASLAGLRGAGADDRADVLAKAPGFLRFQAAALQRTIAARTPAPLEVTNLDQVQWGGAVSMAMEGMRVVMGEMSEEEERAFEAQWLPLFRHPNEDAVAWLNRLIPLEVQFLALRAALGDALQAFDAAQLEVLAAGAIGDAETVAGAMESAQLHGALMRSLDAQLEQVVQAIVDLGDPPDVESDRRHRKKLHDEAFAPAAPAPMLAIVPARLVAVPMETYEFRAVLAGAPTDRPLELAWRFSTGRSKRTPVDGAMKNRFFPKDGKVVLECQLIDKTANRIVARAQAHIDVRPPQGQWVLVSRDVKQHPQRWVRLPRRSNDDVYESIQEIGTTTAVTGAGNRSGKEVVHFRHAWTDPPPRLAPGAALPFLASIQGEDGSLPAALGGNDPEKRTSPSGLTRAQLMLDAEPGPTWDAAELAELRAEALCGAPDLAVDPVRQRDEKQATWTVPEPKPTSHDHKPLPPDGQWMEIRITCTCHRFSNYAVVRYRYAWDPTGSSVPALGEEAGEAAGGVRTPAQEAARDARLRQARVEFHRNFVEQFDADARALENRIEATRDPDALNDLTRDLLYARDAAQNHRDAIASIEGGTFVRTRTELDALNMRIMADESRELARTWHRTMRALERGPRLIELADPRDRDQLREFYYRHVTSQAIASGDPERIHEATRLIGERMMGHLEARAAAAEEDAVGADEWKTWIERVKTGSDVSMMTLSFAGGSSVYMVYQGATGYVEGGPAEAFRRSLSGYNSAVTIANAAIEGYQQGVLQHLEDYAAHPAQVKLDEQSAGWKGAAWSAGQAAALMVAMRLGMHALTSGRPTPRETLDVKRQAARLKAFRARHEEGRIKVALFEQRAQALAAAGQAGASPEEVAKLRRALEGSYREVKTDYFAKLQMNALARCGGTKTLHAYNSVDRRFMKELQVTFRQRMEAAGWKGQRYRLFSNSASSGKAGMDTDLGVVEPPRYVRQDGKMVANPDHLAWRKSLVQEVDLGEHGVQGFRRSPLDLQEAGQRELEAAFHHVYGVKPGEAMTSFTTSYHPEAYLDTQWLGSKGLKRGCAWSTDPAWTQQAADVTGFKVNHLPKDHPQLGYYGNLQEQCRGMVKDFDTKLAPLMERSRSPAARAHVRRLRDVMDAFARNEIGPEMADRRLRLLTGGQGIVGVQDDYAALMQALRQGK